MVLLGADRIEKHTEWIGKARVGLLTNGTGRDSGGESTISILSRLCNLTVLFGPEHGVRGDAGAGEAVDNYRDPMTGLPVYSLYKNRDKRFTQEMLDCFDVLVYDIQDVGARFYTYISTLYYALQDCAAAGKRLIVLDRPNPLGGDIVEGGLPDMEHISFVGCYSLPVRYALTVGELAVMMNEESGLGCDLKVVTLCGWKRSSLFNEWGKIWPAPSLGLLSYDSAIFYPGTCLFEGTNISEGRGTAAPFRLIGAGFIDAEQLSRELRSVGIEGATATPMWFTPTASKWKDEKCGGVLLHVLDYRSLRPVTLGIKILYQIRRLYPGSYMVLPPIHEGGRSMLSLLSGSDTLEQNRWNIDDVLSRYEKDCKCFEERKKQYHIYD